MWQAWNQVTQSHHQKMLETIGVASVQGKRDYMEDRYHFGVINVRVPFTEHDESRQLLYAGVFDGHAGASAAEFTKMWLHRILEAEYSASTLVKCLENAFDCLDKRYKTFCGRNCAGSCVSTVCISSDFICVSNLGDSRVVLYREKKPIQLTRDHKADDPIERQRIQFLGGKVLPYRLLGLLPIGPGRIYTDDWGGLAVARSIGDFQYKNDRYLVSVTPEVDVLPRTEKDDFLLLATDGVWDVLSNEQAGTIIRRSSNAQRAAESLVTEAIRKGSHDNVTAIVIPLRDDTFLNAKFVK